MKSMTNSLWFFVISTIGAIADAPIHHKLLSLEFSDSADLGAQSDSGFPTLTKINDVKQAEGVPGAADFGKGGILRLDSFPHPRGSFTIEVRFFVRDYAPESSRHISDLINTATWDDGPIQGLTFRIGGGYLYPILPKKAYSDPDRYAQSVSNFGNEQRASLSRCVGEFSIAAQAGGTAQWIEVFTDRCVERGRWNHMVAVWDGVDARLFLNGHDATDPWRINGKGSLPNLDAYVALNVGARNSGTFDNRHFDGLMDFVRILDTAMGEKQIRKRYRESIDSEPESDYCHGVFMPVLPAASELVDQKSLFRFTIVSHGACVNGSVDWIFEPGNSAEIQLAKDAGFQEIFLTFIVADTVFPIEEALALKGGAYMGPIYWRVRQIPGKQTALVKTRAAGLGEEIDDSGGWSEPKPLFLAYSSPSSRASGLPRAFPKVRAWPNGFVLEDWRGVRPPRLFQVDGRAAPVRISRLRNGNWALTLDPMRRVSGRRGSIYLLQTDSGPMRLVY